MAQISTIFSILTVILGGVCIMLFVSTKTLRDSRDDQEHRIKQLEDERGRDKSTIGSLETAVKFWRSAATGDEKLDGIRDAINTHHAAALVTWQEVRLGLQHVGETLDHLSELLDRLADQGETP